jgi:hypothetical protein
MEQRQRNANIEIQQVPQRRGENLLDITKKIGEIIGLPIKNDDILACHRVQHQSSQSTRPKNIVVELPSGRYRDNFLQAIKSYNKVNKNDKLNIGLIGFESREPFYVGEHLSPFFKALHAKTRQVSKAKNIKYVWVQNGRILTRKNDASPIMEVRDYASLDKL